jgi:hypothetical protein
MGWLVGWLAVAVGMLGISIPLLIGGSPLWQFVGLLFVVAALGAVVLGARSLQGLWDREWRNFRFEERKFYDALARERSEWNRLLPSLRWHRFPYHRSASEWRQLLEREWSPGEREAFQLVERIYRPGGSSTLGISQQRSFHEARFNLKEQLDQWGDRRVPGFSHFLRRTVMR